MESSRPLDRDRLLADLWEAAVDIDRPNNLTTPCVQHYLLGMQRAWQIVAAAIEDGEYNWAVDTQGGAEWRCQECGWPFYVGELL